MSGDQVWWLAGVVLLLVIVGTVVLLRRRVPTIPGHGTRRGRRPHRDEFRPPGAKEEAAPLKRAGFIVNPTKLPDTAALRQRITDLCGASGWGEPIWLETTVSDPGTGQARQAVADGAVLVCSLGGDGTVRHVAAALVGTQTPLGLLPGGTANLLARNLDLPVDSIERALTVALTGQNKRVDVGRLSVDRSGQHEHPEEHIFLVMAGLGFDAAIMAGAHEYLKARVGPAAYVVSGIRNLTGPGFRVRIKFDNDLELSRRTRTVVIGNCGRLLGGLVLMPAARVDDGALDTILISPKGVVGWTAVAGRILSRQRKGHAVIDHHTGQEVQVRTDHAEEVQVDGDPIGPARAIAATVDHLALVVRVAQGS